MTKPEAFLGLDVGGTTIKTLAFSADGALMVEESTDTLDDGTDSWLERARETFKQALAKCPKATRVAVAAPGLPAPDGGSIAHMPGRLRGLESLNWQGWLGTESVVPVLNDAQAALLGEVWRGAAQGVKNVFLLTLGTGVGGAVMVDGRVLHGHIGRAGHLGHVSLDAEGAYDIVNTPGSLEDAIGEHNVMVRSNGEFASTRELVEAFRAGSSEAEEVWLRSVGQLGAAIAGFINVLDPELILIGGGIADADDALFQPLQTALDKFEWRPAGHRVRLAKAQLGRNAGATGAAYVARLASEHKDWKHFQSA